MISDEGKNLEAKSTESLVFPQPVGPIMTTIFRWRRTEVGVVAGVLVWVDMWAHLEDDFFEKTRERRVL